MMHDFPPCTEDRSTVKIFISYSSKNRLLVEALAKELEDLGHEVWFDKKLTGGQVWWDEILAAICDCDLCVFALTPESLGSEPCRREYTWATAVNKTVLPIMLRDVDTLALPPELAVIHFVDYRKD